MYLRSSQIPYSSKDIGNNYPDRLRPKAHLAPFSLPSVLSPLSRITGSTFLKQVPIHYTPPPPLPPGFHFILQTEMEQGPHLPSYPLMPAPQMLSTYTECAQSN